ncbi:MAG: paraquat-inducible protein A [Paracoccaceae bacterium]
MAGAVRPHRAHPALIAANLALLVLFPLSWFAPLMRAQLLPFFRADEISVVSGLITLWSEDVLLAMIVAVFALLAPMLKTAGLALIHLGRLDLRFLPMVAMLGKLAMADIFLIALYIVIAKGMGVGRLEVAWGLYLFTACILCSLALTLASWKQLT